MPDPRLAPLRELYPGKSFGAALGKWVRETNDGSWRERDLFSGEGSYNELEDAYWASAAGGGGVTFALLTEAGDVLTTEAGDPLRTE